MTAPTYEKSDVTIRGIVWFTVILTLATVGVMALMVWTLAGLEGRSARADAASTPTTRLQEARPEHPPGPVLQGAPGSNFELRDPLVEMEEWDRQMNEQLATSGWVDRNEGIVHIPIERAKELLLERGLPVRKGEER